MVTGKSPSVKTASVIFDGRRYLLTAVLKRGKSAGSVIVTAFAPAVTVGGQPYELLEASRKFTVRLR